MTFKEFVVRLFPALSRFFKKPVSPTPVDAPTKPVEAPRIDVRPPQAPTLPTEYDVGVLEPFIASMQGYHGKPDGDYVYVLSRNTWVARKDLRLPPQAPDLPPAPVVPTPDESGKILKKGEKAEISRRDGHVWLDHEGGLLQVGTGAFYEGVTLQLSGYDGDVSVGVDLPKGQYLLTVGLPNGGHGTVWHR